MKYLALDILKLAGVESPEEKFGKMRVRIGGISCNQPNKVINTMDSSIELVVGIEKINVTLPEKQDEAHAANVHTEKERQGKEASKPYLEREAAKAEATPAE